MLAPDISTVGDRPTKLATEPRNRKKTRAYVPDFESYAVIEGAQYRSVKATEILAYGIESIRSFYDLFEQVRKLRTKGQRGGYTTHQEQDLLRSMLVFSGATLDSVVKQVLRDQIPRMSDLPTKAQDEFKQYISRELAVGNQVSVKELASALAEDRPQQYFINKYVYSLTGDSLQSRKQLLGAATAIGIDLRLGKEDHKTLDEIFEARNQIIHELDYLTDKKKKQQRNRRNRNREDTIKWSERLVRVARQFLVVEAQGSQSTLAAPKAQSEG